VAFTLKVTFAPLVTVWFCGWETMVGRSSGGALVTTSGNVVPTRKSSTKKFPIVPEAPSSLNPNDVMVSAVATSVAVTPALVSAVGLSDWVAQDSSGYLEIAVAKGSRIDELAKLRRALPGRVATSAAGNSTAYAEAVADAYRRMWVSYCGNVRGSDSKGSP